MKKIILLGICVFVGCDTDEGTEKTGPKTEAPVEKEPEHITVQHILIGFKGSIPGKDLTRSQDEARTLAYDLLNQARGGADFGELVKKYTDDQYPGTYSMANHGVAKIVDEYERGGMVAAFGDVGFKIAVNEVGIADHDRKKSPYGWHIIKRTR